MIQTHISRLPYARDVLQPAVGDAAALWVDRQSRGAWPVLQEILSICAGADHYSHLLVLQDDVAVCRDLLWAAERATAEHIRLHGDIPFSLFAVCTDHSTSCLEYETLYSGGKRWAEVGWFSGQALVYPIAFLPRYLAAVSDIPADAAFWDGPAKRYDARRRASELADYRLWKYMKLARLPLWATVPSLVDHLGGNTTTLVGKQPERSRAILFHGSDRSATEIWRDAG